MKIKVIHIGPKAKRILRENGAYNEFSKNILNRYFESFEEVQKRLGELEIYKSKIAKYYDSDSRAIYNLNRRNKVSDDRSFMLNEKFKKT